MPEKVNQQLVHRVNQREQWAREALVRSGYPELCRMAINALQNKGAITGKNMANVRVNRHLSDLKMILARDVKYLLGSEPYFPLESKVKDDPQAMEQARLITKALNEAVQDAKGYLALLDCLNTAAYLGVSYMFVDWEIQAYTITRRELEFDPIDGIPIGITKNTQEQVIERLKMTSLGVWDSLPAPMGDTIEEMPYFIVKRLVAPSEVERLVDLGRLTLPDNIKSKDLRRGPEFNGGEEWMLQWRRDKGLGSGEDGGDAIVMMQYFENPSSELPDGLVYTSLNYWIGVQEHEAGLDNCPKTFKPISMFRNMPYVIGPDKRFGLGLYEQSYDLAILGDDMLSFWLDGIGKDASPPVLIDTELINPTDFGYQRNKRIPYHHKGSGRSIDQAVYQLPRGNTNDKLYDVFEFTKQEGDLRIGKFPYQSGESPPRKETLGTTRILAAAGDAQIELHTTYMEMTGMADTGILCLKVFDANVEPYDYDRYLSQEESLKLLSFDPETIPGGFRFRFKGSASVIKNAQENEAREVWWQSSAQDELLMDPITPRRMRAEATGGFTTEQIEKMYPEWDVHPMNPANRGVPPAATTPLPEKAPNPGVSGPEMIANDSAVNDRQPQQGFA